MGLFRKLASTVTVGAIDFRSDKERTAMYARQTRNAVERQQFAGDAGFIATRAAIRTAKKQGAEAQDLLNRLRSPDKTVRDAAYDQWCRENLKP